MALTPEEQAELEALEQDTELQDYLLNLNKPKAPKIETGMLEAGARGIAQGLTFETADEIAARLESTLTGKPYEQALEESRAEYKASEEEYPVTSAIGGLAGGVAQGIGLTALTGGTAAPATGAQTLSKIAKLGKIAKAALIPSTQKGALKNIGSAALSGATYGGLTEIGASEKEGLERLQEVPRAALTGAAVGGVLGGAVEAGKKTIGYASKKISTAIDEGNLPASFRKIRDLYRAGLEKKGYSVEKATKRVDEGIEDAAEKSLSVLDDNKNNLRTLKSTIISQVDKPVELDTSLARIADELGQEVNEGASDAIPVLNRFQKLVETKLEPESTSLSATSLNDLISKLDDYIYDNPETSVRVQNVLRNGINELKLKLRIAVTSEDVQKVLNQNPELKKSYLTYVKNIADSLEDSPILSEYEKKFFAGLKKSKTSKDKKFISQGISPDEQYLSEMESAKKELAKKKRGRPGLTPEEKLEKTLDKYGEEGISDILAEIKDISKQNPLGQLDTVMHHILNASETLGVKVPSNKDPLARKFKIFDILRGNTAETGTGQKAVMRYEAAINELEKANEGIAKQFKQVTEPAIKDLENQKFLQGSKLGEGPKDQGALQSIITAPAIAAGLTGNLLAQATKSSSAKTLLRPTVAFLENLKSKIDDKIVVQPESSTLKFLSKSLEDAIVEKNESRRAAALNTLMQYETIRKLFKEEENER